VISACRGTSNHAKALIVCERWSDNAIERFRVDKRVLVQNSAVEIQPSNAVISLPAAIERYLGSSWQFAGEFAFGEINTRDIFRVLLKIVPDEILGLGESGPDISISRNGYIARVLQSGPDKIVDKGNGLSSPTMSDDVAPALLARVEGPKVAARPVLQGEDTVSHSA